MLDHLEREHPSLRIVRLRPGLIFKAQAATEIRRLFAGPFLPRSLPRASLIPIVPDLPRLRFQAVHSLDVGEAYRLAALSDAHRVQHRRRSANRVAGARIAASARWGWRS